LDECVNQPRAGQKRSLFWLHGKALVALLKWRWLEIFWARHKNVPLIHSGKLISSNAKNLGPCLAEVALSSLTNP